MGLVYRNLKGFLVFAVGLCQSSKKRKPMLSDFRSRGHLGTGDGLFMLGGLRYDCRGDMVGNVEGYSCIFGEGCLR